MEILRARGTEFRGVNQEFLCVRGRFGYDYVNSTDRLSSALVRQGGSLQPTTMDAAVAEVAKRLREIVAANGPGSVAILGGERLNVEEQYLLQKLARGVLGTNHVDARTRFTTKVPGAAFLKATGGGRPALTFGDLYAAQETLVLFDDLQGESPFAQATAIRGQRQKRQHITVAHARRVKLARVKFKSDWLGVVPGGELALLNALTKSALDLGDPADLPAEVAAGLGALKTALASWTPERITAETGVPAAVVAAAAKRLREAERKAVLFGRAVAEHPQAPALLQAIENLGWATGALTASRSFVMYSGPQSDSQGALDMGLAPDCLPGYAPVADASARGVFEKAWGRTLPAEPGLTAPEILDAVTAGRIRALWIVGDEWLASSPDRAKAELALGKAEFVVVNEMFLTATARNAHVVFPVASFAEKEGAVTNCERRVQKATRALSPRRGTKPDWEILQLVAQALGADWRYRTAEDVYREIARLVPGYHQTSWAALMPDGVAWSAAPVAGSLAYMDGGAPAQAGGMWLLSGGTLFAQGSLSARSATLANLAKGPRAFLGAADAARLGLAAGDRVELAGSAGTLVLPFELDDSVPANAVFVPYALVEGGLGRLGAPAGAGLRVQVRKVAATERVGA
jgi:predicted molibdopterin-dependent oxidoreductase YjgC